MDATKSKGDAARIVDDLMSIRWANCVKQLLGARARLIQCRLDSAIGSLAPLPQLQITAPLSSIESRPLGDQVRPVLDERHPPVISRQARGAVSVRQ
jgi:hypothetical protein